MHAKYLNKFLPQFLPNYSIDTYLLDPELCAMAEFYLCVFRSNQTKQLKFQFQ